MKLFNALFLFLFLLLSITTNASVDDEIYNNHADEIVNKLKDFAQYNKENYLNRDVSNSNHIIYYSPGVEYNPSTPVTVEDWLLEDPIGMVPFVDEYREWLLNYNDKIHGKYNSKIQHYVIVVDIYRQLQADIAAYKGRMANSDGSTYYDTSTLEDDALVRKTVFDNIVNDKISTYISNCRLNEIFDVDAKVYITLAYVDRNVVNRKVQSTIKVTGIIRSSETTDFNTTGIDGIGINGFYQELYTYPQNEQTGLNLVGSRIKAFIDHFWGEGSFPTFTDCQDAVLELNPNSNITEDFLSNSDYQCANIINSELKDIVITSAEFLDWVAVNNQHIGPDTWYNINYFDPVAWKEKLNDLINEYVSEEQSPYSKDSYAIWLKERHAQEGDTEDLDRITRSYLGLFYDPDEYTFKRAKSILISDFLMLKCSVSGSLNVPQKVKDVISQGNPRNKLKLNEDVYGDFNKLFSGLNHGAYTSDQKQEIYQFILDYNDNYTQCNDRGIEWIFWHFYLNPFAPGWPVVGPSGISMSKQIADFMVAESGIDALDVTKADNFVIVDFKDEYANSKSFFDVDVIQEREISYNYEDDIFNFDLTLCGLEGTWTITGPGPGGFEIPYCDDDVPFEQAKSGFFKIRYAATITQPGYFDECVNGDAPCSQDLALEPAFYSAYKIRENNAQETLNDIALAVEVLTFPIAGLEMAAARGAWRIIHGIWLANTVASIYIQGVTPEGLATQCKSLFGDDRGAVIAQKIITINTIVAFTELGVAGAQSVGNFLKVPTREELITASAAGKFNGDYKADTGAGISGVDDNATIGVSRQLESDMKSHPGESSPAQIDADIDAEYLPMYGIPRPDRIKQHPKLRRLINRSNNNGNISISQKLTELDDIIIDASTVPPTTRLDKLISDINSKDELLDFLEGTTGSSSLSLENRINAWNFLFDLPNIRKQIASLENMTEVLDVRFFENAGISEDVLRAGVVTSNSKAKMIERLKEASQEGSSVEDVLDAFAARGKVINHKMVTPESQLDEMFDDIDYNATNGDVDSKYADRQSAPTKQEKIVASELLAEARVDQIYESKGWTRVDIDGVPAGKQGKFDRVYVEYDDITGEILNVHVIEAKGGAGKLGPRTIGDGSVAQQGSPQYRDNIVETLLGKELNEELQDALEFVSEFGDEDVFSYVLVRQSTSSKETFIVKKFPYE